MDIKKLMQFWATVPNIKSDFDKENDTTNVLKSQTNFRVAL